MDEKIYTEFILAQLAALKASAETQFPADHKVLIALDEAITAIGHNRIIPVGFTEDTYDEFLTEQIETVFADSNPDDVIDNITDVVGTVVGADGTLTEVGDVVASGAAADDMVAAYEEEMGEVEVGNSINITYTRIDGNELTVNDVQTIIDHPASDALKHLGTIQLLTINETDDVSKKEAVFGVLETGAISLKALALGAAAYRGVSVFPGLGRVQAIGATNFA